MKIVFTTGIYAPRTPPPPFFAGIPIWVKYFLRFFFGGVEPTTPTPHAGPTALPRHSRSPSLAPPCYINQNPEVAEETDRQLAKNAPIDMNQTVKQVPNTPPWGGGRPYSSGFRTREVQIPKVRWRTAVQYFAGVTTVRLLRSCGPRGVDLELGGLILYSTRACSVVHYTVLYLSSLVSSFKTPHPRVLRTCTTGHAHAWEAPPRPSAPALKKRSSIFRYCVHNRGF